MSINSLRYPHYQPTNWNPVRDFTYIIGLSGYTIGIVVRADAPWKTLEELIDAAKKEPDKYNYATSGIGGTGQLTMIEVEQTTGAKFTHVPYKGTAEWTQALLAGEVHFICDGAQWAPFVGSDKFRILAMATEQRIAKYKDVPTLDGARHRRRRAESLRPGRPQGPAGQHRRGGASRLQGCDG